MIVQYVCDVSSKWLFYRSVLGNVSKRPVLALLLGEFTLGARILALIYPRKEMVNCYYIKQRGAHRLKDGDADRVANDERDWKQAY